MSKGKTWISLVDKHTKNNLGFMLFDTHVDVMSVELTEEEFQEAIRDASPRELEFYKTAKRGVVLHLEDVDAPMVNANGKLIKE